MQYLLFWLLFAGANAHCVFAKTLGYVGCYYQINSECSVMLKWHFLTLTFCAFLNSVLVVLFCFRPSTKRGPDLGEAVPGREAECS